ncbi:hypothetical protein F4055_12925 [Candidatus Poribacteria bacterium]|nr:hypothetical protein [Candidatus Poribacteria bacterium]
MSKNVFKALKGIAKTGLQVLDITVQVLDLFREADRGKPTQEVVDLKSKIIHVFLRHAHEYGRDAYMRPSDIGKEIGTYRLEYQSRKSDPLSRKHHELLRKLEKEGWVEHSKRVGWRLTKAAWDQLTS